MTRFKHRPALAAALACIAWPACAALDVAGLDPAIAACTDFYQHVNRNWIDTTPIPDDRTSWGTASLVDQRNEAMLLEALDAGAKGPRPPEGSAQRKAIDFYASGMDLAAIERAGMN